MKKIEKTFIRTSTSISVRGSILLSPSNVTVLLPLFFIRPFSHNQYAPDAVICRQRLSMVGDCSSLSTRPSTGHIATIAYVSPEHRHFIPHPPPLPLLSSFISFRPFVPHSFCTSILPLISPLGWSYLHRGAYGVTPSVVDRDRGYTHACCPRWVIWFLIRGLLLSTIDCRGRYDVSPNPSSRSTVVYRLIFLLFIRVSTVPSPFPLSFLDSLGLWAFAADGGNALYIDYYYWFLFTIHHDLNYKQASTALHCPLSTLAFLWCVSYVFLMCIMPVCVCLSLIGQPVYF